MTDKLGSVLQMMRCASRQGAGWAAQIEASLGLSKQALVVVTVSAEARDGRMVRLYVGLTDQEIGHLDRVLEPTLYRLKAAVLELATHDPAVESVVEDGHV